MLIDDENIRVQYDSTAESPIMAGDALPFPFRFIEKEQVKAILLDGTKLVFNEDYTVGLEEEEEEKLEGEDEASVSSDYTSVILNIDIPVGETITLYRETDLDQTSEFPQEARFSSRKIEDALDKLTMQNQEQREALGRAMKLPLTAAVDLKDLALPNPEPNKSVKWNSEGTALVNTSFDPDTALVTTENFKKQAEQSAKDSASSAAASANSATVAGQKVNEITALHSDYMDDINTTSTNYLNQINSRGNTIIKDADTIINRVGLNMFDPVIKDHVLTYPDGQGLALQGTWVYRDAKAGERYGYPDFYERCVKEFKESSFSTPNVKNTGAVTRSGSVISGFADGIYSALPTNFAPGNKKWEINIKATTSTVSGAGEQDLFAFTYGTTNATRYGLRIVVDNEGKLYVNLGTSTTAWVVLNTTYTLKDNTTYYFKLRFNISHYILGVSTDNKTFTEFSLAHTDYVTTFARCMLGNWTNYNTTAAWDPWLGSIDLSGCNIYVDGQKWWDGTELYRHSNEHYYYHICSKPQIDARQESMGMSWYYGVDEVNKRIFLPRNNWFMQMASSGAGNFTDAGLPNITGSINATWESEGDGRKASGAFTTSTSGANNEVPGNPGGGHTTWNFNASRSSAVYGKSTTVQPKSVKQLLYICVGNQVQTDSWVDTITQVKNGAKEIDDSVQGAIADVEQAKDECIEEIGTKTAELTSKMAFQMFDTILKDHMLSYPYDQGFALQGTYVYHDADPGIRYGYPDFYNKCIEEKNQATSSSVTLGSNAVTIWTHSNGHMYYDISEKEAIDTFFNSMGMAWYYGVDTENKRIFLPRNNWFEQSATSGQGGYIDAGLPNITGGNLFYESGASGFYGAIYNSGTGWGSKGSSDNDNPVGKFDASRSNNIYGKSSTVQPKAVKKLLYICVGNRLQDTSWIDVVTQVENGIKDIDEVYQRDLNNINSAYNSAMKTLQAVGPVLQTGSTMTGQLNFKKTGTQIWVQTDEFEQGVPIDSNRYCGIQFNDKNNSRFGKVEGHYLTDGTVKFGINAHRNVNGTAYYAQVLTWVDANGGVNCSFPMCTSKATTTSSASTSRVAVVVQNYVNGTSWYRVWSDGWIEQGSTKAYENNTGNYTISLLKPFSNANYTVIVQTGAGGSYASAVSSQTATSFTGGYLGRCRGWYACGY